MPDRIAAGDRPHAPLSYEDVVRHFVRVLETDGCFPHRWAPPIGGEPVNEAGSIERQANRTFIYRSARARPSNPHAVAEVTEKTFTDSFEAADWYLRWELRLPGDLDGWKVID